MGIQIVMDHTGDTRHAFEAGDSAAVADAMARFDRLVKAGYTAAERTGQGASKLTRSFNPDAETLFIPRLQGG